MARTGKGLVAAAIMAGLLVATIPARMKAQSESTDAQIRGLMGTINARLEATAQNYRVEFAEYLTSDSSEIGRIVFFTDRGNKQFGVDYVPFDPRRGGGSSITYIVDQTEGAVDGLTVGQTTAAIDRAMTTWDNVACSTIPIVKLADLPGVPLGVLQGAEVFADITHAGWLPGGDLPANVIAVTATFIFITPPNIPTDIDNNGKADTAFAETYYHDAFTWRINGNIDVETVALHESGHGLSQGHFGEAFLTPNGSLHFNPRAVMNAAYSGVQQSLTGTDIAGHCGLWGSWPNN